MAIKRRKGRVTMAADTGSVVIGLGADFARVIAFEFKGDDANVDDNTTLALSDRDGRILLAATALDAGTDDSATKDTSQEFSTVGVGRYLAPAEAKVIDKGGDPSADTEGAVPGIIARSPVTASLAAGTAGDVFEIALLVEV